MTQNNIALVNSQKQMFIYEIEEMGSENPKLV